MGKTSIAHFTAHEREVMGQLFIQGPTWDGNIVSKDGRDHLIAMGYARRYSGWTFLTEEGVHMAIEADLAPYTGGHTMWAWVAKQRFN